MKVPEGVRVKTAQGIYKPGQECPEELMQLKKKETTLENAVDRKRMKGKSNGELETTSGD